MKICDNCGMDLVGTLYHKIVYDSTERYSFCDLKCLKTWAKKEG